MRYVTAIFFILDGKDMVQYEPNHHNEARTAAMNSIELEEYFKKENKKAKDVHVRTFEFGMPNYYLK